jgi:hypothetical protein
MSGTRGDDHVEEYWPDSYEAPTLEPLGSVWDRTGAGALGDPDGVLLGTI